MKTAIFIFLVGAAAGAYALYTFQEKRAAAAATTKPAEVAPAHPAPSLSDQAREEAKAAKAAVAAKLAEWHLTPDEISKDLARSGEIVRTKAEAVGSSIASSTANARIVTTIKTKYTLDKDLSGRAIAVACENGHVTLSGSASNPTLIAKAVALALDTDGVTQVTAKLVVVPAKN
jgi:osmotically-inducible protein OsmY